MAEWLKAHDSKSCGQKCLGGSNPLASAKNVCIDSLVAECRFGRFLFEMKANLSLLMVAESVNERDTLAMPYLC